MNKKLAITLIGIPVLGAGVFIFKELGTPTFGRAENKTYRSPVTELGSLRTALSIYFNDSGGTYPARLDDLIPKYLPAIPAADIQYLSALGSGHHPPSSDVHYFPGVQSDDSGGWGYVNDPNSKSWGNVFVNCAHDDLSGKNWTDR